MTAGKPWPYNQTMPCAGCRHRHSALGVVWCGLDRWTGARENERRCELWEARPNA